MKNEDKLVQNEDKLVQNNEQLKDKKENKRERLPQKLHLEPKEVYRRILEIKKMKSDKIPIDEIEKKTADFFMSYPVIVDKALDGTLDMQLFRRMVQNAQAVHEGRQDKYQTELEMGEELAEKFMYPKITPQQRNAIKKAINENKTH